MNKPIGVKDIDGAMCNLGHYHAERNHQGLGNALIESDERVGSRQGSVRCRKRLGGMLNYYYREAA